VSPGPVAVGLGWGTTGPVSAGADLLGLARQTGLDSFWTIDHLISIFPRAVWDTEFTFLAEDSPSPDNTLDFATVLGHLASQAGGVQLGVGVTDPHRRHPALLAQTFLTLAQLTERPPILGIGTGARENLDPYGIRHDHAVSRVEEALRVVRACLDADGPIDFRGRFYTLDQALMDLRPPAGRTPQVWLGANGPRMLELAGRYADGWYPWELMTPTEYEHHLATVQGAAKAAGRAADAVTPALGIQVVVAADAKDVRRLLGAKAIRYIGLHAGTAQWRRYGVPHPLGEGYPGLPDLLPHRYSRAELDRAIAAVPDELLAEQVIAGTPAQVLARLGELVDAGLRHAVLIPVSALASAQDAAFSLEAAGWLANRLRDPAPGLATRIERAGPQ
jgi:phthiodiolone/phenolphthiodiolone dimycocerosates ketoreductase